MFAPFTVSMVSGRGVYYHPLSLIFLDSLSVELAASGVGCTFNSKIFNHLVYADDTVLLVPFPKALQRHMNICVNYANYHAVIYNGQNTKFMCIKPAVLKQKTQIHSQC